MTGDQVSLRVWAPGARAMSVVVEGLESRLDRRNGGYFETEIAGRAGTRYGFKLDDGEKVYADPASRSQPDGPHGMSEVVDPSGFPWRHDRWPVTPLERAVVYEMHIGTFTPEGTWRAAIAPLAALKDIGITVLEIMPIAEFPGTFGWGYDGVHWFAPYHHYGTPDDFRAFVDAAHGLGLNVILDVVYNHLGPDGNYLPVFAPQFFTKAYINDWGDAINFDGEGAAGVRAFAAANAAYWIAEFRLDGFRFDAVQQIFDKSPTYVLAEIAQAARDAARERPLLMFGEHEPQHARLLQPGPEGGAGIDALWNDDFHHSAFVALVGQRSAYTADYTGHARELLACARHGFLFQGQRYAWQKDARGEPALAVPAARFVAYLENHDQVANLAPQGSRLHQRAQPGQLRAMTALLLLGPWTPMLFQGQEFSSSKPFTFFADHEADLSEAVARGRREFLTQFRSSLDPEVEGILPAPHDRSMFEACVLSAEERRTHAGAVALHTDLLRLRATDPVLTASDRRMDGAAIDDQRLVLRFFSETQGERLLVLNLGTTLDLAPVSEPLVAPPARAGWRTLWHSERPLYGGTGMPPIEPDRWEIPGFSAVLLGGAE
ncbi:MAG: malto-oligosyltrehalose trehalohydrolase [Acidobacteriota bacterium]|nr:malto-oligosyltrehalose trehalohydrolase [Acidobacteriota bacterium]